MHERKSNDRVREGLIDFVCDHPQYFFASSLLAAIDRELLRKINGPFPTLVFQSIDVLEQEEVGHVDGCQVSEAAADIYASILKLIRRTVDDRPSLEKMLNGSFGQLDDLTLLAGERDWGAELKALLSTNRGHRIIYKTRSSGIDLWFDESLKCIVPDEAEQPNIASSIDRDEYSWHQYLSGLGSRLSDLSWNTFAGSIDWMVACRLTDCHDENIANLNGKLTIFDLEMVLQPFKATNARPSANYCCHFQQRNWSVACLEFPIDGSTRCQIDARLQPRDRSREDRVRLALSVAQNFKNRIVLLPTYLYQKIIDECAKFDMVGETYRTREHIRQSLRAFRASRGLPEAELLEAVEAAALEKRVVPRFWSRTGDTVLGSGETVIIDQFFDRSGIEAAQDQIDAVSGT